MRVGIYVDAFNLYYGGRYSCGRSTAGWRWIDIRGLAIDLIGRRRDWAGAFVDRVVYCTARIDGADNPDGHRDQDIYLKALVAAGAVDHIEYGKYIAKVRPLPLATKDRRGRPLITTSAWPVMVQADDGSDVSGAKFLVSVAMREEKGSDVNVASHLLIDSAAGAIDAAVVISNDSDLRLPIAHARTIVPLGLVNPTPSQLAGDLRGQATDGARRHWWAQLTNGDFRAHQLADPVGPYSKPQGW